ncbi:MAG: rhomboid family intramembrane serine protease [Lentisphaerae bacterium]|nr:rhomboid family intramembrane serine protease [Lentisphaerota bacterium]
MLDDRPYMRFRDDFARHVRDAINTVWILIAVNVLVYLTGINNVGRFALWADSRYFEPYQLITYMFLHGGFTHVFFNMYGLFIFGRLVAPVLGRQKFLWVYFISGVCGGLLHLLANWNAAHPPIPTVGASGALFGVMMAVAMTRPNVEMYIMFIPVPVKMKTLVIIYAVLEILSNGRLDNIAHLAHLGGFIGAYIFLLIFCKREVVWSLKDLFKGFSGGGKTFDRHAPQDPPPAGGGNGAQSAPEPHITHVSQKEVDRLLDKISREGVNSLTDYERAELQHFREQMQSNGR